MRLWLENGDFWHSFVQIWNNRGMSLGHADDILCFVAIVRAESLAGAARTLRVPASTLSRRLSTLEQRLGVRLLERTTRSLHLTEIGEAYFTRCAPLADALAAADEVALSLAKTPRGVLRVSAPPMWGALCLAGPLAEYAARYPAVRVQVDLSERSVNLRKEGFDAAIRLGVPAGDGSYRLRRLGFSPRVLCASPEYLRRSRAPQTVAELREHALITLGGPTTDAPWRFSDGTHREVTVALTPRLRVNNAILAHELSLRGAGIALLQRFQVRADLEAQRLIALSLDLAPTSSEVLLLTLASSSGTPKVRAFVALLHALSTTPGAWQ